jgi:hypothetical protein
MAKMFSIKAYRTKTPGLHPDTVEKGYEKLHRAARRQGFDVTEEGFYPVREGDEYVHIFHGVVSEGGRSKH